MDTSSRTIDIAQLAERAGVTVRTVRYYVAQGLLPSPGVRGPTARYDERHVARLQLIRRLQREHLPLAEIRRRLETMRDEDVSRALTASPAYPSPAVEYARSILARSTPTSGAPSTSADRHASPPAESRSMPSAPMRPFAALVSHLRSASPASPASPPKEFPEPTAAAARMDSPSYQASIDERDQDSLGPGEHRSTWERIPLAPDLELHVRRPLSREQNRLVTRILRFVHNTLNEEG